MHAPRPRSEGEPRVPLVGREIPFAGLTSDQTRRMLELLARHFSGVTRSTFLADLGEKTGVVVLEDARGELRGFSTFLMYATRVNGRPLTVVYSGDTIVEPSAWGSSALPRAWLRAVYARRCDYPEGELRWLLLTSGFRTYRFASVFCHRFFPRHDEPTPPCEQALLDGLSRERFGARYDARRGIVRLAAPQVLRGPLLAVPEERVSDPHVRFFLERNPGHRAGDELVSLASLDERDLTPAGRRMLGGSSTAVTR